MDHKKHLFEELENLYENKDESLRHEHSRSLPFQDAIFDRWARANRLGFAEGASIYNSAAVFEPVSVGQNTWIGPYVILDGSGGGIKIGKYCSISAGVHIYTHDTVEWALNAGAEKPKHGEVQIGDCCYIGAQSIIAQGVSIGERCIVGANSFVNRSLKPNGIYAGSPARKIGDVVLVDNKYTLKYDSINE